MYGWMLQIYFHSQICLSTYELRLISETEALDFKIFKIKFKTDVCTSETI